MTHSRQSGTPKDESWFLSIHERLLNNDHTASSELAEAVLDQIITSLHRANPSLRDPDILQTAAIDAVLSYIKRPQQYDPAKRGLFGYLVMSAQGDLKNALAALRRRQEREVPFDSVELSQIARNMELTEDTEDGVRSSSDSLVPDVQNSEELRSLLKDLTAIFDSPVDMEMAKLILQGERDTAAFAKVLGIDGSNIDEQRKEVKRQKDRIKKRIERWMATR